MCWSETRNCKMCRYYKGTNQYRYSGLCQANFGGNDVNYSDIYKVSEDGILDGALQESLASVDTKQIKNSLVGLLVDWKVSRKRQKEFEEQFDVIMEAWLDKVRYEIEPDIDQVYKNWGAQQEAKATSTIIIKNPGEFSCSYFE